MLWMWSFRVFFLLLFGLAVSLGSTWLLVQAHPAEEGAEHCVPIEEEVLEEPVAYDDLRFVALLPNPAGADAEGEFIVLENTGDHSIPLAGVMVRDQATHFSFPEDADALDGGAQHTLFRSESRIALNNAGQETVQLLSPEEELLDEVIYQGSFEDETYQRTDEGWQWDHELLPMEEAAPAPDDEALAERRIQPIDESVPLAPSVSPTGRSVRLSEILPNPAETSEEEWIELVNPSSQDAFLAGYQLDDLLDGGSRPYTFPEGTRIAPGAFFLVLKSVSGLTLNNTSDGVSLLAPDGSVLDTTSYTSTSKGMSLSFIDGSWHETTPTPGAENAQPAPTDKEVSTSLANASTEDPSTPSDDAAPAEPRSIQEARTLPEDSLVSVTGVVTADSGTLVPNGFVLEDDTGGIQVLFPEGAVPSAARGERVTVIGSIGTYRSTLSLRAEGAAALSRLGKEEVLSAAPVSLTELSQPEPFFGRYIETSGYLLSKSGQTFVLEDQGIELRATFRERLGIPKPTWKTGSRVTLSGIFFQTTHGPRLYPLSPEDLAKTASTDTASSASEEEPSAISTTSAESLSLAEQTPSELTASLLEQTAEWTTTDWVILSSIAGILFLTGLFSLWRKRRSVWKPALVRMWKSFRSKISRQKTSTS